MPTTDTQSRILDCSHVASAERTARMVIVQRPRWDAATETTYPSIEVQVHLSGPGLGRHGSGSFMTVCDSLDDAIAQAAIYGATVIA